MLYDREQVKRAREMYPVGTRVRLIRMADDPQPIAPGTEGTVTGVDDMAGICIRWDNGRGLKALFEVDELEILKGNDI